MSCTEPEGSSQNNGEAKMPKRRPIAGNSITSNSSFNYSEEPPPASTTDAPLSLWAVSHQYYQNWQKRYNPRKILN